MVEGERPLGGKLAFIRERYPTRILVGEEILSPCERLRDFAREPTFKLKKVPGIWQWNICF